MTGAILTLSRRGWSKVLAAQGKGSSGAGPDAYPGALSVGHFLSFLLFAPIFCAVGGADSVFCFRAILGLGVAFLCHAGYSTIQCKPSS